MLAIFLFANLATGCVNMGMDTLSASDWEARVVVWTYMVGVAGVAAGLDVTGFHLKL